MNECPVSIAGNIANIELKYLGSGKAVCEFSVAVNTRVKQGDQWVDGPANFWTCVVWEQTAENVAESCPKGTRVVVVGQLDQDHWTTDDGSKRNKPKIRVESIGVELRWATAAAQRNERTGGQNRGGDGGTGSVASQPAANPFAPK